LEILSCVVGQKTLPSAVKSNWVYDYRNAEDKRLTTFEIKNMMASKSIPFTKLFQLGNLYLMEKVAISNHKKSIN